MTTSKFNIKPHAPLLLASGTVSKPVSAYVHARFWLDGELGNWHHKIEGGLDVIQSLTGAEEWREVDLGRYSLRRVSDMTPEEPPAEAAQRLEKWLKAWRLCFYRQSRLKLYGKMGESRDDFRKRVADAVREMVKEKKLKIDEEPLPLMPWRKRTALEERERQKKRLTAEASEMVEDIESTLCAPATDLVQRAEFGMLFVGAAIKL